MARIAVSAEGTVEAPADTVYLYIADMREHHSRFLPPAFSDFRVESGGVGAANRSAIAGGTLRPWKRILARVAALQRERNAIDAELARLIGRPMTSGHLGEWIAARVFDIELEASAVAAGIDGRFRSDPLQGRTVNTGPPSPAVSSRDTTRPWCIEPRHQAVLPVENTCHSHERCASHSVNAGSWPR